MRSKRCRERREKTDCGCCTGERERGVLRQLVGGTVYSSVADSERHSVRLSPMWVSGIVVPDVGPLCTVVAESPQSRACRAWGHTSSRTWLGKWKARSPYMYLASWERKASSELREMLTRLVLRIQRIYLYEFIFT